MTGATHPSCPARQPLRAPHAGSDAASAYGVSDHGAVTAFLSRSTHHRPAHSERGQCITAPRKQQQLIRTPPLTTAHCQENVLVNNMFLMLYLQPPSVTPRL